MGYFDHNYRNHKWIVLWAPKKPLNELTKESDRNKTRKQSIRFEMPNPVSNQ